MKDPVCHMDVNDTTSAPKSKYEGETYYFCSMECKETFDLNPSHYVSKATGAGTRPR